MQAVGFSKQTVLTSDLQDLHIGGAQSELLDWNLAVVRCCHGVFVQKI